jgi:putative membrane protein
MRKLPYLVSVAAVVTAVIGAATPASAQPYGPGMMGWGYGFGLLHMIIWLVILAAIVAGVVWLVRTGALQVSARRSPGLQVLEERYARGEINRDEYLRKKQDISD